MASISSGSAQATDQARASWVMVVEQVPPRGVTFGVVEVGVVPPLGQDHRGGIDPAGQGAGPGLVHPAEGAVPLGVEVAPAATGQGAAMVGLPFQVLGQFQGNPAQLAPPELVQEDVGHAL